MEKKPAGLEKLGLSPLMDGHLKLDWLGKPYLRQCGWKKERGGPNGLNQWLGGQHLRLCEPYIGRI